ncbi:MULTISPECIES: DNA-3-methyladenine glycosylase [Okeania]|uniref:Putative 3-methyladenine DNA glycosylase n=1 Tax=Okeania hirsuta TaxID=1458930 RepID=A0A3N6P890_9CYAN|nr:MULTISPECIES: DNA-3-methyladenine glycosylase [Okeania]NET75280.1 DNA-3-methyladenine glycosylase [Okeania sp. SIO1F9]RQH19742.1 DNA-3-methyladenine glycosylase [Okeania hirsuta]RQH42207.1 DNA-3-methyladenine glycosylase [Okeania hirsuta]
MNLIQTNEIINNTWLERPSPEVAPDLVGCTLVRRMSNDQIIRSTIVETEAYAPGDPACHAYRSRTPRNAVMFGPPGMSYVYLIYGMYHCLNIVTDADGVPSVVLIRALQLESVPDWLWEYIPKQKSKPKISRLAAGPGKLCRLLDIDLSLNGSPLGVGRPMWLEHPTRQLQEDLQIVQKTRIGIRKGTELPWRWYLANCDAVSKT